MKTEANGQISILYNASICEQDQYVVYIKFLTSALRSQVKVNSTDPSDNQFASTVRIKREFWGRKSSTGPASFYVNTSSVIVLSDRCSLHESQCCVVDNVHYTI
jgi:hypothetical protein